MTQTVLPPTAGGDVFTEQADGCWTVSCSVATDPYAETDIVLVKRNCASRFEAERWAQITHANARRARAVGYGSGRRIGFL